MLLWPQDEMSLTGIQDTDILIFFKLDYGSLLSLFQVDSTWYRTDRWEEFWRQMVERDFGVARYKLPGETYQRQYRYLKQSYDPNIEASAGRLDAVVSLCRGRNAANIVLLTNVIYGGHLHILQWLEHNGIPPNHWMAHDAAHHGQIDILEWLEQKGVELDRAIADCAESFREIKALDWLVERGIFPTSGRMGWAVMTGRLDVLDHLLEIGRRFTANEANRAVQCEQLDVLEWLAERRILPTVRAANWAKRNRRFDMLEWLVHRGIRPE